jgi:SAM-dependent methyltransferase
MTQAGYVANDPAAYERQMGRWSSRLAARLVHFARIGQPASALDLGCGTGSLSLALAEAVPDVRITGVDLSPAYLAHARSKTSDPRITFEQADATALHHADASFDAVLSLLVLNFVSEPARAIREMVRVARPGGTVAAAVWDFRGGFTLLRMLADTAAIVDPDGESFRTRQCTGPLTGPGELAAAWSEAGLQDVEQTSLTMRMDFASFADCFDPWLAGQGTIGAYIASRTPTQRDAIARHVERAYLTGRPDGPRSFAATAWAVRGTR